MLTPLLVAAQEGRAPVVDLLLSAGARVEVNQRISENHQLLKRCVRRQQDSKYYTVSRDLPKVKRTIMMKRFPSLVCY